MARKKIISKIRDRIRTFLNRRPHRSFKLSRRREYKIDSNLPGYFSFSKFVFGFLYKNKKIFLCLALFYAVFAGLLLNMVSQNNYESMKQVVSNDTTGTFDGFIGSLGSSGLLFLSGLTGSMNNQMDQVQQFCAGLIAILTWLTSVWLIRNILAGHKVKVRDGIYNSGAPLVPTVMTTLLFLVQLLPFAIAVIAYVAASGSGLLDNGIEAMLFWVFAGLMTALSVYWAIGTIFSLVIITIPGMYPMQAIRSAGDLVTGRRMKILARLAWMFVSLLIVWAIVLIPSIMIETSLAKALPVMNSIPIIPILFLIMSSLTVIWVSSYVYLFYRRVVSENA